MDKRIVSPFLTHGVQTGMLSCAETDEQFVMRSATTHQTVEEKICGTDELN